jgi:hypothetical protein
MNLILGRINMKQKSRISIYQWLILGLFAFVLPPTLSLAQEQSLFINEFVALKHQIIHDVNLEYDDWVEIYNGSDTAICIAGYYITDDLSQPKKFQISSQFKQFTTIAPKGYLLLWFDKGTRGQPPIHIPLKLSGDGEQIGLFSPDGDLIDAITFETQIPNISYARLGDGNKNWGFAKIPTPGFENGTETVVYAPKTNCNLPSGFYESPIQIKIKGGSTGDTIMYTLDGTTPSKTNGTRYSETISIEKTTVVRSMIINEGMYLTNPSTQTYFINEPMNLPVFSMATDDIDILESVNPAKSNYGEFPCHLELFRNADHPDFELDAGFKLVGKAIRSYPQKSLAFKTRVEYGSDALKYPLFQQKPEITKVFDFLLRNSGNDNKRTLIRDGLMHSLVSEDMHIDYLAYEPVVLYVNGKYWGIHNLREKISQNYLIANYPNTIKNIDLLEWKEAPIKGDEEHFDKMINYVSTQNVSFDSVYDSISQMIDLDNYIDYIIAETFYANTDWPMANIKYWRPKTPEGKWRWILFDTDLAFELNKSKCPGHHNSIAYVMGVNNCHLPLFDHGIIESTLLFRNLIENENFKTRFINRYVDLLNTNFSEERVSKAIQDIQNKLEPEMAHHCSKWSSKLGIRNVTTWETEMNHLYKFAKERPDSIRFFLDQQFELGKVKEIQIAVNSIEGGRVQINSITPTEYPFFMKYFSSQSITINAIPYPGYVFKEWKETGTVNTPMVISVNTTSYTAIFEKK